MVFLWKEWCQRIFSSVILLISLSINLYFFPTFATELGHLPYPMAMFSVSAPSSLSSVLVTTLSLASSMGLAHGRGKINICWRNIIVLKSLYFWGSKNVHLTFNNMCCSFFQLQKTSKHQKETFKKSDCNSPSKNNSECSAFPHNIYYNSLCQLSMAAN